MQAHEVGYSHTIYSLAFHGEGVFFPICMTI